MPGHGSSSRTAALSEDPGKSTAMITLLYTSKDARDNGLKSGMQEGMLPTFDHLDKLLLSIGISDTGKEGKLP